MMETKQLVEAEEKCKARLPQDPSMHFYLAIIYQSMGRLVEAKRKIMDALDAFDLRDYILGQYRYFATTHKGAADDVIKATLEQKLLYLGLPRIIVSCLNFATSHGDIEISITIPRVYREDAEEDTEVRDANERLLDRDFFTLLKEARKVGVNQEILAALTRLRLEKNPHQKRDAIHGLEIQIESAKLDDPNTPEQVKQQIREQMNYLNRVKYYMD